ncbi:MAG TPA: hypothetical protein VNH19_02085 [Candidatus Limnocylindrales bacterium]|nr:hypothetical protein [Candidatus Limnocylindrales bacterium]
MIAQKPAQAPKPEIEAEPVRKKGGRPPLGDKPMTATERKRASRTNAEIERIIKEQAVDDHTGGAYGPGRFMTDAEKGKGELVTGGYNSAKIESVDAAHFPGWDGEESTFARRTKPPGAGSDSDELEASEVEHDPRPDTVRREITEKDAQLNEREISKPATLEGLAESVEIESSAFEGNKYSAAFNHEWDNSIKEREWDSILGMLMFETHVCASCDWFSLTVTDDQAHQHARDSHPNEHPEDIIRTELRCIVCDRSDRNHIRDCELTKEDREFNKDCDAEIFKLAGRQKRKMTDLDKTHRKAVRTARRVLRKRVS